MVLWTALSEVEETRAAGLKVSFPPLIARIVNISAPHDFPAKFCYRACPFQEETGWLCKKSLEFGDKCGHNLQGVPRFRFQFRLVEASHSTTGEPIVAQMWDIGSQILDCSPEDFWCLAELDQLLYVFDFTQSCPRVRISLSTKDYGITVTHLSFLDGRPKVSLPRSLRALVGTPSSSTSKTKRTAKKSEPVADEDVLAAIGTIVRKLKLVDED